MKLSFQTNEDTEEIIKLRLQLAKNKSKVVKYQQIIIQITQLYQLTTKLIERLNLNHVVICNLGKILGITQVPYQNNKSVISFQVRDSLSQLLSKYSQMLTFSQEQNEILKLVCLKVEKIGLENEQIKEKHQQLQNKHSQSVNNSIQAQKLSQKVKQLTLQNSSKQQELRQMEKKNLQLKKEYSLLQSNLYTNQDKNRYLQSQIQQKKIQIQRLLSQLNEEESIIHQKAKIIEKCNKLISSVQLADDQYITHYFRSNGLPLDVQRPLKNKYQLVFE